jgi:hypothetical protein
MNAVLGLSYFDGSLGDEAAAVLYSSSEIPSVHRAIRIVSMNIHADSDPFIYSCGNSYIC